jgi:hypothetical protein
MSRVRVWRAPAWETRWAHYAPRWCVDDGYRTTVADSWNDAMDIALRWAGVDRSRA